MAENAVTGTLEGEVARLVGDLTRPAWKFWVSRKGAAEALGKLGPTAAAATLALAKTLATFKDDPQLASAAMVALGQIGKGALRSVPSLVALIQACTKLFDNRGRAGVPDNDVLQSIIVIKTLRWQATRAVGQILGRPWDESDSSTSELMAWWTSEGSHQDCS